MTEYTYQTIGVARFELSGWYRISELEQLVVDLKKCNERYNEVLAKNLKEMGEAAVSYDRSKITHNLASGDRVRVKGFKTMSTVKELDPREYWENCVVLTEPLRGWTRWDAHALEKV